MESWILFSYDLLVNSILANFNLPSEKAKTGRQKKGNDQKATKIEQF